MRNHAVRIAMSAAAASYALLGGCSPQQEFPHGSPAAAALAYFEATTGAPCAEVFAMYTAETQQLIRAREHRDQRERDGLPQPEKPEERYCAPDGWLKRGSVRLLQESGDEALVAADFSVTSSQRLFRGTLKKQLRLVRENGVWRIPLELAPRSQRQDQLFEIGRVDVFYSPAPPGLLGRIEATFVAPTSRARLDSALRDPTRWANALPGVVSVELLAPEDELPHMSVSFSAPERSLTIAQSYAVDADDAGAEVWLRWGEDAPESRTSLRGSWGLKPNSDGSTRITLILHFDAARWPATDEGAFSPERVAEAVLALDRAAQSGSPSESARHVQALPRHPARRVARHEYDRVADVVGRAEARQRNP
jgi:hypothetical protein